MSPVLISPACLRAELIRIGRVSENNWRAGWNREEISGLNINKIDTLYLAISRCKSLPQYRQITRGFRVNYILKVFAIRLRSADSALGEGRKLHFRADQNQQAEQQSCPFIEKTTPLPFFLQATRLR
jgi:hypothetical protein